MKHVEVTMRMYIHPKFDTKNKFIQYLIKFFGKDGMLKNVEITDIKEL